MTRILVLVILVAVSAFGPIVSSSHGADTTAFRVTSYIPQYFKDFQLQTTGGFDLSGNDNTRTNDDPDMWQSWESDGRYSSAWATVTAEYKFRTVQKFLNVRVYCGSSIERECESGSTTESEGIVSDSSYWRDLYSSYSVGVQPRVEAGFYVIGDAFLTLTASALSSYGVYLAGDHDTYSREIDMSVVDGDTLVVGDCTSTATRTDRDGKLHKTAIDIRAGWGREYDGSFAVAALEVVNKLRKAGLITREPSYGEMMRLSETIHYNRQTHAVDSRLRRIDALTELLTQIADAGVVTDPGPYGFALVEDVWDYYPLSQRQFGWIINAGVGWSYEYNGDQRGVSSRHYRMVTESHLSNPSVIDTLFLGDSDTHSFVHKKAEGSRPYLGWQFEYARPLSLRWQLDCAVAGTHYLGGRANLDNTYGTAFSSRDWPGSHQITTAVRCGYYYDTRTSGSLALSYEAGTAGGNWETLKTERRWAFSAAGDITYRLSVPTTLQLTAQLDKGREEDDVEYSHYTLSAGITHWLF